MDLRWLVCAGYEMGYTVLFVLWHCSWEGHNSAIEVNKSNIKGWYIMAAQEIESMNLFFLTRFQKRFIVCFTVFLCAFGSVSAQQTTLESPVFTTPPGLYHEPLNVQISHPDPEAELFYTLDGSSPGPENTRYIGPVVVSDRSGEPDVLTAIPTNYIPAGHRAWMPPAARVRKATVIRAIAVIGEEVSETASATYMIIPEGEFFSGRLPVLSIITDQEHFFSDETGIYVPGNTYNDNDGTGNYYQRGDEWERPASLEWFDHNGQLEFSQNIGVRIHGGWSRRFPMKSLRLYARSDYGTSRFYYPVFPELPYDNYNRLILRSSGNDFGQTLFMDAAAQSLVRHFNVDTQAYRPSVVFINGEYWGIHNIRERYDRHYLERVYGAEESKIELLTSNAQVKEGRNTHYQAMVTFISQNDLSDPSNMAHVETLMDTDNFLDYYSAQIYYGNNDWPHNNIDFWRYNAPYNPNAPKGLDGRWRWLMYDVDRSIGYYTNANYDMVDWVIAERNPRTNQEWPNLLLRNLLENEEFFHRFINRMCDHLNSAFHPERAAQVVDSLKSAIEPYMEEHIDRWQNFDSMGRWNSRVNGMFTYVADRPAYMHQHIQRHFDVGDLKEVRVFTEHTHRGHIKVNSIDLHPKTPGVVLNDGHWAGSYFEKIPVTLEAVAQKGYQFSHWVKHGSSEVQEYPDEKITIFPDPSVTYEARFEVIEDYPDQPEMLYYWVFTDHLPNNTPLYQVDPVHALDPSGRLFYSPAITIDPENTEGIMDRVNDPVDINYHPEFLQGLPFEYSDMRGIRVRNPSLTDTSESNIVFFLPTAGYQPEELTFLARRTSNGQRELVFEYALEEDGAWISGPEEKPTAIMYEEWKSITLPFADIEEASDNPYFRVRIRFGGDEEVRLGSDGNVRFNSISLTGWEKGGIVTPDPPDDPEEPDGCGAQGITVAMTEVSGSRSWFWSGEVAEIRVETVLTGNAPCLAEIQLYKGEQVLEAREMILLPYQRKTSVFYPVLTNTGEISFIAKITGQEDKKSWTVQVHPGWVRESFSASGDRYAQGVFGPVHSPDVAWNVPVEEGPVSQPVLKGDNLWFTAGNTLYEVHRLTGSIESEIDFESVIVGNPVIAGEHILFYSDEGVLYAYKDGISWSKDFGAPITEDPLAVGELLLVPVDENKIYGLRVHDGEPLWIREIEDGITGKLLYSMESLYFSSNAGYLKEMHISDHWIETVKVQKDQEERALSGTVAPVIGSKRIYAISRDQKKLLAIDRKTMEVEWTIDLDTPVSDVALGETALFVAYEDGTIESREQTEGSFLWSARSEPENGSRSYTFSLLKTSSALYASYNGFNSGFAALGTEEGGILWWSNDGVYAGHPVVMDGWMYIPGPDEMMALKATSTDAESGIVYTFHVHQNYPNPFNPATMIRYDISEASMVEVAVYDITGRLVEVLIKEHQPAGMHQYIWDASRYSSGVYLLRVRAGEQYGVRQMTLIR